MHFDFPYNFLLLVLSSFCSIVQYVEILVCGNYTYATDVMNIDYHNLYLSCLNWTKASV